MLVNEPAGGVGINVALVHDEPSVLAQPAGSVPRPVLVIDPTTAALLGASHAASGSSMPSWGVVSRGSGCCHVVPSGLNQTTACGPTRPTTYWALPMRPAVIAASGPPGLIGRGTGGAGAVVLVVAPAGNEVVAPTGGEVVAPTGPAVVAVPDDAAVPDEAVGRADEVVAPAGAGVELAVMRRAPAVELVGRSPAPVVEVVPAPRPPPPVLPVPVPRRR